MVIATNSSMPVGSWEGLQAGDLPEAEVREKGAIRSNLQEARVRELHAPRQEDLLEPPTPSR